MKALFVCCDHALILYANCYKSTSCNRQWHWQTPGAFRGRLRLMLCQLQSQYFYQDDCIWDIFWDKAADPVLAAGLPVWAADRDYLHPAENRLLITNGPIIYVGNLAHFLAGGLNNPLVLQAHWHFSGAFHDLR